MTESEPENDPVTPASAQGKVRKAECAECGGRRNCDVRGEFDENYDDVHVWGRTTWYILQCRGCDYVFIQTSAIFSEDWDHDEDGSMFHNETHQYWPGLSKRKMPDWMVKYEIEAAEAANLHIALKEVYGALDNDLRSLAEIGIRTTFDIASGLLGINENLPFTRKLDELVASGRIGAVDRERLTTLIDAGSAAAHRGWRPNPAELGIMMDVLEHFILESFVTPARRKKLDAQAAKVRETVPPRARTEKAGKPRIPSTSPLMLDP